MKIKELPEDIREIALHRIQNAGDDYIANLTIPIQEVYLINAFVWESTIEGDDIWCDVLIGKFDSFREFHKKPPTTPQAANKYQVNIKGTPCDVYDVLKAFDVRNPAIQHAIKKLLMPGKRGHKDKIQDLLEAKQSIVRAINLENE